MRETRYNRFAVTALFHSHSGLRFLVLLAGVVAMAYSAYGLASGRPFDKAGRVLGSIFVGLLDLQILLGLAMVALGFWYPALIGHLSMMLVGAAVSHVVLARNRKKEKPSWLAPLLGIGGTLLLIVLGIMAISRGVFAMSMGAS